MTRVRGRRPFGAIARIGLTLAVLATAAGCRRNESPPAANTPPQPGSPAASPGTPVPARLLRSSELTDAERQYGHAPVPDPAVTYQPDVVIVEGGARAIRALRTDGLGCTVDARAARAAGLQPGRVAMVTGRCVGRVLAIREQGDQLALTLGPVEITDVVREGSFALEQPLDLDDTVLFKASAWPGTSAPVEPLLSSSNGSDAARFVRFTRQQPDAPVVRDMPLVGRRMIGAWIPVSQNGVEFLGHATLHVESPRIRFVLKISGARVTQCELEFHGAAGLTMGFKAGTQGGGNLSVWKDLPVDVTIPIQGPVPFSVLIRQGSMIKTAFTARNSIVQDFAEYTFTGSFRLGYNNGSWGIAAPTNFTVKHSPLTSLNGASMGVTGIVLLHRVKVMVGIGAFGFATGPYTALDSTLAVTRGSDAAGLAWGPPTVRGLARCKQATIAMDLAVGIGYMIPRPVTRALNALMRALNIKHRIGSSGGLETNPLRVTGMKTWEPDLEVCRLE